jgi:hypothetical protein
LVAEVGNCSREFLFFALRPSRLVSLLMVSASIYRKRVSSSAFAQFFSSSSSHSAPVSLVARISAKQLFDNSKHRTMRFLS